MKATLIFFFQLCFHTVFAQPQMFEPGLISNNQVFGIAMSPSGDELLYVRAYGGRDALKIYRSELVNSKWQQPALVFFDHHGENQIDPSFSPDGNTILFNEVTTDDSGYDVFTISKTTSGWGEPQRLPAAINTSSQEFYATMSNNRNVYFTRRMESNDIFVSQWLDGAYQVATPLPQTINTEESESNPYISPDEDFIIFISVREDGFGNADLYISFKDGDQWSYPINLGDKVNTELSEFCPSMDFKNDRFFFSRTQVENEHRIENIFSISLEELKLDQLRPFAKW